MGINEQESPTGGRAVLFDNDDGSFINAFNLNKRVKEVALIDLISLY